MLTAEQNDLLTRVGPGTPLGNLMRRYWMPALLSGEVLTPDSPPVRVRLLGEQLVAFRDTSGRVGLLRAACPHRKVDLFFGRNEEDGLRCVYHGWKFDVNGQCVDMPSEPAGSNFQSKVRTTAYPIVERGGVVWAYMGPADKMPPYPDFEWARVPEDQRAVKAGHQHCNWLQALEGGIDSAHSSFLHNNNLKDRNAFRNRATAPTLEVMGTDFGFTYGSVRQLSAEEGNYVRVYHYVLPFHQLRASQLPGPGGTPAVPQVAGHMWVPMDDENTRVFSWAYCINGQPLVERNDYYGGKQREPVESYVLGVPVYERRLENDFLIDREEQKHKTFTGIANTTTQDRAVQESMGAICDRTDERLGTSDRAVIAARRLLLDAIRTAEDGGDPMGVNPSYYGLRAIEKVLPPGARWQDALAIELYEDALP